MTQAMAHDAYLAAVPDRFRPVLIDLRARLTLLLPEAEEVISYAMPGFRIGKSVVAGYAAFVHHCGYYPHSGGIVAQFETELRALGLRYSKSGVNFTAEHPIPQDMLERLVRARKVEAGIV